MNMNSLTDRLVAAALRIADANGWPDLDHMDHDDLNYFFDRVTDDNLDDLAYDLADAAYMTY